MGIATDYLRPRMAGFNVIDCEVKNREVLYLLAREDYTQHRGWHDMKEPPPEGRLVKRVLGVRLQAPDANTWSAVNLKGMGMSCCALAATPEDKVAVVDIGSKSWVPKSSSPGFEPEILSRAEGGILRGAVTRARCFGGSVVIANTARQLFERPGPGAWQLIGPPMEKAVGQTTGFEDFDRFGPEDWYAVGGSGDIWHFDGTAWRQCRFPSNWGLSAVCCAGDGHVYVAAGTALYRGRGNDWERMGRPLAQTIPLKDLVWYEDRLWATSDYGLWVLDGKDQLVEAEVESGVRACAGNLAVRDGVMLLAGYGGAAYKQGGRWTELFSDGDVRAWFGHHRDEVWTPPAR